MLALAAILGVARVAGAEGGHVGEGGVAVWEPVEEWTTPSAPADDALSGLSTADPSASAAEPTSSDVMLADPPDWWSVLAQLDQARASALAAREVSDLDSYAVPDSPAWHQDADLIGDLHKRGLTPVGLMARLVGIEQAPDGTDQGPEAVVELVIVDERSAYSLVDDAGAVVEQVPASGLRRWRVRLVGSVPAGAATGWRLHSAGAVA